MPLSRVFRNRIAKRLASATAIACCAAFAGGCVMDAPSQASAAEAPALVDPGLGAKTSPNQTAPENGIPRGCTREWSASAMDSVLYCPDIRPPEPH